MTGSWAHWEVKSKFDDPSASAKDWLLQWLMFLEETSVNVCYHTSLEDPKESKKDNIQVKGGFYLNAIFPPLDMALMAISRSRFKQSRTSTLIP